MSRLNVGRSAPAVHTHGGVPAFAHLSPIQQLRRSVLACLLWEDTFYESGVSIADRIAAEADKVSAADLAALAIEARTVFNLRHVSLWLLKALSKKGGRIVGDTIYEVIQRADELGELVSMIIPGGDKRQSKARLPRQVKLGLARALRKFSEYQLAKYNRDAAVTLRDVLFIVHAKPKDEAQNALWKRLVDDKLATPDTWEVELSAGKDKKATFERLLREGKLGYLALLRNLRNMADAGCDMQLVRSAIIARNGGAERVLPFRYVAAARACPQMEPAIDEALSEAVSEMPPFSGKTLVLVDVSSSMHAALSAKSDMNRIDAAAALACMIHGDLRVFSFSDDLVEVPPRRGMAGVDAIKSSQRNNGTALAAAVAQAQKYPHDRIIVITDEQSTDSRLVDPVAKRAYMINVASYEHGVGYGKWTHLDGFSEGVLRYIHAIEGEAAQ